MWYYGNDLAKMAKGKPVSCSLKPAKLVALLGLVLVLSGIGFGYLAFDAGVRAASGSSGGWQDAMLAATGTQQMVSATICVSIGARRRSAQAAARACPPRRALTPHAPRRACRHPRVGDQRQPADRRRVLRCLA